MQCTRTRAHNEIDTHYKLTCKQKQNKHEADIPSIVIWAITFSDCALHWRWKKNKNKNDEKQTEQIEMQMSLCRILTIGNIIELYIL